MRKKSSVGSRIRERRLLNGVRQIDLAEKVGISAAYLNLIEHDRRRIAGKLLRDIATQLGIDASVLSQGAEAALIEGLSQASSNTKAVEVEIDRIEEFAGRFPGWAQLIVEQSRDVASLKLAVQALNDRLSHDPFLSDALHEVLSVVTSLQSSASILVESGELEKEWRDRFQRNIFEDSTRLAQTSQTLVGYLDPSRGYETGHSTPDEEFDRFMRGRRFMFPEIEENPELDLQELTGASDDLATDQAKVQIIAFLDKFADLVKKLPKDRLADLEKKFETPAEMQKASGLSVPDFMLRLAYRTAQGNREYGYVVSDASGALLMRRSCAGFTIPNVGQACPIWPIFSAFSRPLMPMQHLIRQVGRDGVDLNAYSVALPVEEFTIGAPPRFQAHMLLWASKNTNAEPESIGVNCRICALQNCPARREASIISDGF